VGVWCIVKNMKPPITHTVPSPSAASTVTADGFLSPHPAWDMDTDPIAQDDPCAEYFNADGSLTEAAYEFLHREWATGRMI